MIYIIAIMFATMAYQAGDEGRTPNTLDEKVRKQQPYLDQGGKEK